MDGRADLSSIASFDKSKLKRAETVIKQKLPSQQDIESEKGEK